MLAVRGAVLGVGFTHLAFVAPAALVPDPFEAREVNVALRVAHGIQVRFRNGPWLNERDFFKQVSVLHSMIVTMWQQIVNFFKNLFSNNTPITAEEPPAEFKPAPPTTPVATDFFPAALEYTFKNEGGFSNVKEDKGGPTKYGITIGTLTRWRGKAQTADAVRNLTKAEAEKIYRAWYWTPINLSSIEDKNVAIALFDRAVLNGLEGVSTHVENVLGEPHDPSHNFNKCIEKINQTNPVAFVMRLADQCEIAHRARAAKDPTQKRFLKGWLNRVNRMRRELGDGTTE